MQGAMDALKARPCVDCGVQYLACAMQFDHVRGHKLSTIGRLLANGYGDAALDRLADEIAKCVLVCANCHAVRTHDRQLNKR